MKFSIERKVLAGLITVLLLMAGIGLDSYLSINRLVENTKQASNALDVRRKAQAVLLTMLNLETGTRGYVITGEWLYLQPYRDAVDEIGRQMTELSGAIGNAPEQQERVHELNKLIETELKIEKHHVDLRQAQDFDAASSDFKTENGKREMDQIRVAVGEIVADQDALISRQLQQGAQQARQTTFTIAVGGACGFLFVAVLCVVIQKDFGRRRAAAEQLALSEERFRQLVEGASDYAIFMLDAEGRVKTWNAGAQRIKGYERQEIIGQHFSRFYPPEDIKSGKPQRILETALREGQYEEEGWRVRKDGSRFWASVLITRLLDSRGNAIGFSKIARDLTERKLAEEQLHNFFTLSIDMLCIAGIDGYFKLINPAWAKALGYTEAELLAKPYLEFVHPDDREATIAAEERVVKAGFIERFENRYRCASGSYRWLTWTASLSSDGQRMFASARDITDDKGAEEEIEALNKTLLGHNEQLEAINNELEAFSYSVSHDLRAPLRSLDGFSQALLEDCVDKLDSDDQDNLRRIRAASQRMGRLIDDLLNLSRLTRVEMTRQTVDLSKMARETAQELRASDTQRDVEFVIADGLAVEGDPPLLGIALTNLLGNAWKFTSKRSHARIELGSTIEDGNETFFVRDNGVGFDMAFAGKLFGAFQRLHGMQDFSGTGIGLATVQRIFRRHGGRIWAESAVDAGATFHFTLSTIKDKEETHGRQSHLVG